MDRVYQLAECLLFIWWDFLGGRLLRAHLFDIEIPHMVLGDDELNDAFEFGLRFQHERWPTREGIARCERGRRGRRGRGACKCRVDLTFLRFVIPSGY